MPKIANACNAAIAFMLLGGSAAVADTHMENHSGKDAKSGRVNVISAGQTLGADIFDRQGNDLGDIEYVLVDTLNNDVRYIIVEREMDDAEEALVPLPWKALTKYYKDGDLRIEVDAKKLKQARTVKEDELDTILAPTIVTSVYNFWVPAEEKSKKKSGKDNGTFLIFRQGVASTVIAAMQSYTKIEGSDVFDRNGDEIGEINDLVIRKSDGDIAFATVAHGGFLGVGDKHTPVPLGAFVYNTDLEGFQIGMGKKEFAELESFDDEAVPSRIRERDLEELRGKFKAPK